MFMSVQGFYHMDNTSTKCADDVSKEIERVLGQLRSSGTIQGYNSQKK